MHSMSPTLPIPAAQYLRMSTEDQQYSIANQRLRIREYAQKQVVGHHQEMRRPRQKRRDS
jgi:DNA invertase Pin-like site-specific DNA recombinase